MAATIEKLNGRAFLAFPEMAGTLLTELAGRFGVPAPEQPKPGDELPFAPGQTQWAGDLLYCPDYAAADYPYWSRTTLVEPFLVKFASIGEAAKALKDVQRSWAPYQYQLFRRAELIREKLPFLNLKTRPFPGEIPHSPMGIYTLLDDHTMIASAKTTSDLPAGRIEFEEDHVNPPSRAYLKIQESLTMAHHFFGVPFPGPGQKCFDAGACPGGWTWALRKLGADVFAVDRSPLATTLMRDPHVKFQAHDAFTLKPEDLGAFDWVVSDVICYPDRLLPWIQGWLASKLTRNMICTIKLQGELDWNVIKQFGEIPDSRVVHLNYNKHELTFIHSEKMV